MRNLKKLFLSVADIILLPFVYPSAWLFKKLRQRGLHNFTFSKKALLRVGVFPIRNHYYEPQFDFTNSQQNFSQNRNLPGIDLNIGGQLSIMDRFIYSKELENIPKEKPDSLDFHINNKSFGSGDAEYWYQLIRSFKPRRIIEIGSGNSTLMAEKAIRKNRNENPQYECEHICIEPYEIPWLEDAGVRVIRKKVEDVQPSFFSQLRENDILFIDSSHIIRPYGDVLFEYLELLPSLNKGVIVHIHDVFTPKNYPRQWLHDQVRFWNEQYLLEAFLTHNADWKILGALNFLKDNYFNKLKKVAPFLSPHREPGSFYIQKIN